MKIPFQLHPRVFASLGSDLVTNDIVAVIELVKNSFDAMAKRVDVRVLRSPSSEELYIEIQDDGCGMSSSVIKNVWCVVATPYRLKQTISREGKRTRRVSGAKGLGRLSSARLGNRLELVTKMKGQPCWQLNLLWNNLSEATSLRSCEIDLEKCPIPKGLGDHGTLIRIYDLSGEWDETRVSDLRQQLSRLISPFSKIDDFRIWFLGPDASEAEEIEITPPKFLDHPPYLIRGKVDEKGALGAKYRYSWNSSDRKSSIKSQLWPTDIKPPSCGAFNFEIRAWDIDSASVDELSRRFDLNKATIRKDIRSYHGMSLYRDEIIVLPKSDSARDWLGLDLRRVSRIGVRMSTSQIVGYVAISSQRNKKIRDTSDRERLEDNRASRDFKKLLVRVVDVLADERSKDRIEKSQKEQPFHDLFGKLSASGLVENINEAANRGASAQEVLPLVEEYSTQVQETIDNIERRLIYYSRLASLGVLSAILVHEVRNHTFTIAGLIDKVRAWVDDKNPQGDRFEKVLKLAERGISSLERLAERFAPLASRAAGSRKRYCVLEEIFQECIEMREKEIEAKNVTIKFSSTVKTPLAVDPGEMTAIIINLLDNAIYWLSYRKDKDLRIEMHKTMRPQSKRVNIRIDDTGPGVSTGDEERVFYPGYTRKPDGLGMGLTVASEIVAQYGGKMGLIQPGFLRGASFEFDLPMAEVDV